MEIKTEFGLCRFCQSEGQHRDIMKEYNVNGKRENYSDIFLECFNIFISTSVSQSALICMQCVENLRAACAFRELVLHAEQGLTAISSKRPKVCKKRVAVKPVKTDPTNDIEIVEHDVIVNVKQESDAELLVEAKPVKRELKRVVLYRWKSKSEPDSTQLPQVFVRKKPVAVKLEPVKTEPMDDVDIVEHDVIVNVKQESDAELLVEAKPVKRELKREDLYRCKSTSEPDSIQLPQAQDKPKPVLTSSAKMAAARTLCKFRCVFCGTVFTVLSALKLHQKLAHKVGGQGKLVV